MTLYKGTTPIAGLSTNKIVAGRFLLEPIWSDHIINDIQYLRADTFSWQDGLVYVSAYNKLVEEYSAGTEETEGSITFRRSSNNFKIATSDMESAILNKYNSDGISWYYILDTINKRFKLPRMKYKYWKNAETLGVKGNGIGLGFSINTQYFGIQTAGSGYAPYGYTGSYGMTTGATQTTDANITNNRVWGLTTDSSKSGIVADVSDALENTGFYLYFYVGEYAQTAIEQTAGITSEELNSKADIETVNTLSTTVDNKLNKDHSNDTKPYLKTCYVNGTSGYNIWSNGYCEQWGYIQASSSTDWQNVQVTFLKTFANTNYNLVGAVLSSERSGGGEFAYHGVGYNKSTTGFYSAFPSSGYLQGKSWRASGYLAEGEY